eukprot:m.139882 g.139882  ORF g.139882 m.139882 type:complete len:492 (+) comp30089_c1_seq1:272-1747(+)
MESLEKHDHVDGDGFDIEEGMIAAGGHPGSEMNSHSSHNRGRFYRLPRQQKQWGEDDPVHHFNPFDTFFDLVFVGGAFAVGDMLKSDLSPNGIMIFISAVLLLRWVWWGKVMRDTRFHFSSAFHKSLDVIHLVFAMIMVLNFEPTPKIIDAKTNAALGVSFGLLGTRILDMIRDLEIDIACKVPGYFRRSCYSHIVVLICSGSAITYCYSADTLEYIWIPWLLAGETQFFVYQVLMRCTKPRSMPPMNLTYFNHRDAEWAMLMLGEAIFSLLYIPSAKVTHGFEFYVVFILGTVTVTMMCLHYFANYEERIHYHAMKVGRQRAMIYASSRNWISVCLVAMGTAFKIMLYHLDDVYIKQKYANVFAYSFAFAIFLSDIAKLLHANGTKGSVLAYFRFVFGNIHKCVCAKILCAIWILKLAVVAVAFSLPHLKLNAVELAAAACALATTSMVLVSLQNHKRLDLLYVDHTTISQVSPSDDKTFFETTDDKVKD